MIVLPRELSAWNDLMSLARKGRHCTIKAQNYGVPQSFARGQSLLHTALAGAGEGGRMKGDSFPKLMLNVFNEKRRGTGNS